VKPVLLSLALYVLAGLAEIGGGWLIWAWLRESRPLGMLGVLLFTGYGILQTLQPEANFGRVYAAYGGIFVLLSMLWGAVVERSSPDRFDWLGVLVMLVGAMIILWGRTIVR
jgi:small multidrug resistance family-3 protein